MTGPDPYSFRALWRHYRACRRNKRNTKNALAFEVDAEVFAADFRDRVVHHLLVAHQEPVFERVFIHDSYACRKGKGTLAMA